MVKLARETGKKAEEQTTRVAGRVTRDGKPVAGGRVGAWQKTIKEMNRPNVTIQRGRTVPKTGYESAHARVGADGTFVLENLSAGHRSSHWYFVYQALTGPPTIVGPVTIASEDRSLTVDIATKQGGAIEGRVENVPDAMAGKVWIVAFDETVSRRTALVSADGTFRLENLPPGRYGLKAGHDAYEDPHVPRWKRDERPDPQVFRKTAEPWQGAVVVTVEPGQTVHDVIVDFRPPGPLVEPVDDAAKAAP